MQHVWKLCIGIASVVLVTALIVVVRLDFVLANVSMVYLLVVFLVGLYVGRSAAIISSILSFIAIDWFFVEPKYTLSVHDSSEWLALCTFLLVSTITGQLTSRVRSTAAEAKQRQTETETLAKASWAVSSQLTTEEALTEVLKQLKRIADVEAAAVVTFDKFGNVVLRAGIGAEDRNRNEILICEIKKQLDSARLDPASKTLWTPVASGGEQAGAVYIKLSEVTKETPEQKRLIDTLVNHAVVILQREELMKEQSHVQALKEVDKLKTALLSMISHDFRSPLTGIKAAVSALLQEPIYQQNDTADAKLLLQGIEDEADRINRMVGNVLNLSRLEADAWKPNLESSSLAELIGSALASFSADDNRRITVRLPRDMADVMVDQVQIEQVIKNLVDNSLKYSDKSTLIEITVNTLDDELIISVMDRGLGISEEDLPLIFDRFYRNQALKESSTPGAGIGLAICRSLVEAHHGQISARSRNGGGAIFEIRLPVKLKQPLLTTIDEA